MKRIGVFICECGPNIAEKIDIDSIVKEVSSISGVEIAERYKLLCSKDGKEYLKEKIKENKLTHLVLGACSPKQHEKTFIKVCEEAGMNPYLCNLINIREQCAWMTPDREEATAKALRCIRAGIARVKYQQSLEKKYLESNVDILVIGGGITGLQTSLLLASDARKVYLVEKNPDLGGMVSSFKSLFEGGNVKSVVKEKMEKVLENKNIEVFTNSEVKDVLGFFGNFIAKIEKDNKITEVKTGAVVVATGCSLFDPGQIAKYKYGKLDDIYTSLEIEVMNMGGRIVLKNGREPQSVAIVHCVGREEKGYCSKICCSYSAKFHDYLREKNKDVEIHNLYYDLCTSQFERGRKDISVTRISDIEEITEESGKKHIEYLTGDGKKESVSVDMVILLPVIEPGKNVPELAAMLRIPLDARGFFAEEHVKLNPVATSLEGIYIAGCVQGPKNILESITQSEAVAGKILCSLIPGKKLEPEVMVSRIAPSLCTGCQTCLSVCSYGAIVFDRENGICVTNEMLCRGCGNCASACPSNAITHKHFTSRQIYQELTEVLYPSRSMKEQK
ncbi:MAG: CoB--CoM heterodisulfide reductase iron-sulfur subunit A family protein [Spirochaetales bacterium]|nr:CoB--CoM heterodisulfide reductase iron-sulfur subunit A family protein [Spirochaetales bacterium]